MRIRKNSSRLPQPFYSDEQHQAPSPCQPMWSPSTHNAHDAANKGDRVTTDKRCNQAPVSEEICGLNQETWMEDNYEDYLVHIPCRAEFMCRCVALNKLDEDLKMDDMHKEHVSNKHKAVNSMKQDIFLKKRMDVDGKIMRKQPVEGSNNGEKCKEQVIDAVVSQGPTWTRSKLDDVKDLVPGMVTLASAPTSSKPRQRRKVAYGSGKDYFYYTQFGASRMKVRRVRRKMN